MGTGRVLDEAASLGLSAIEAGPEGFLPSDPADALRVLGEHDLSLVGDSCRSCCTAPNDAGASSARSSGRKFRVPGWPPDVWVLTGAEPG
jgi:sugar phosphate isomerase/epimerase